MVSPMAPSTNLSQNSSSASEPISVACHNAKTPLDTTVCVRYISKNHHHQSFTFADGPFTASLVLWVFPFRCNAVLKHRKRLHRAIGKLLLREPVKEHLTIRVTAYNTHL